MPNGSGLIMDRRGMLRVAGLAGAGAAASWLPRPAIAQGANLKVGFMLPHTGTFAKLGKYHDEAFRLFVEQKGGKLAGRTVEYVTVDDESKPEKAAENMNRLVGRDKVDVVVGTVHSGVAMGMVKVARENGTLLIIPNAGANAATRAQCAGHIFRTSFSNWQPSYPMGKVAADAGHKNAVTFSWKYGAGEEATGAFKELFARHGGSVAEEMWLPFPDVEFQAQLTKIAQMKPDCVFVFFAGGGAVKFVKDWAAAGLKGRIPLYASGFLTEGVLPAQGEAAEGLKTTLHYSDDLDNAANKAFRAAFRARVKDEADVYAVQGYDAAALLAIGLDAVKGDTGARDAMYKAMREARIDSPRGPISFSASNNVVQNIYLREVKGGRNVTLGIAHTALADPGTGCKL